MLILGLDPGPTNTGWALYCTDNGYADVRDSGSKENLEVLDSLQFLTRNHGGRVKLAIEMVSSYGMPVGREVFETCVWIGRFQQAWHSPISVSLIPRREVKEYLCAGNPRAGDANVRSAIIEMFPPTGGGKIKQIGTKEQPGPLHGVVSHAWAALGVALCLSYRLQPKRPARIQMDAPLRMDDDPLDLMDESFRPQPMPKSAMVPLDLEGVQTYEMQPPETQQ